MQFSITIFFFIIIFLYLPVSWLWLKAKCPLGKDITFELQRHLSELSILRFCPWYNNFLEEKNISEYSADFIKSVLLGHAHILWGVWFSWTFEWLTYWHAHLCKVNFKVLCTTICRKKVKSTHKSICAGRVYCCGIYLIYHKIPTSSSQYLLNYTRSPEFKIISITWFFKLLTQFKKNKKKSADKQ